MFSGRFLGFAADMGSMAVLSSTVLVWCLGEWEEKTGIVPGASSHRLREDESPSPIWTPPLEESLGDMMDHLCIFDQLLQTRRLLAINSLYLGLGPFVVGRENGLGVFLVTRTATMINQTPACTNKR
jgi:hypothetical protein